jgi:hypothetical protein
VIEMQSRLHEIPREVRLLQYCPEAVISSGTYRNPQFDPDAFAQPA